jgi:hypothetical protein
MGLGDEEIEAVLALAGEVGDPYCAALAGISSRMSYTEQKRSLRSLSPGAS